MKIKMSKYQPYVSQYSFKVKENEPHWQYAFVYMLTNDNAYLVQKKDMPIEAIIYYQSKWFWYETWPHEKPQKWHMKKVYKTRGKAVSTLKKKLLKKGLPCLVANGGIRRSLVDLELDSWMETFRQETK